MLSIAQLKMVLTRLWTETLGPEPDIPIPRELQPPESWGFDLTQALKQPSVWDALHAEEQLWLLREASIEPLTTTDGFALARVVQIWRDNSTPEDVGLFERVHHARSQNLLWRTQMDTLRRHLAKGEETEHLVPSGR